jgi:hypothetical protein
MPGHSSTRVFIDLIGRKKKLRSGGWYEHKGTLTLMMNCWEKMKEGKGESNMLEMKSAGVDMECEVREMHFDTGL